MCKKQPISLFFYKAILLYKWQCCSHKVGEDPKEIGFKTNAVEEIIGHKMDMPVWYMQNNPKEIPSRS